MWIVWSKYISDFQIWLMFCTHGICKQSRHYISITIADDVLSSLRCTEFQLNIHLNQLRVILVALCLIFVSCNQAALRTLLSVGLSVCLWNLFHNFPVIGSSRMFQKLLPLPKVVSMQKVKVRCQKAEVTDVKTNVVLFRRFRVCNSSLNTPMAMKLCTKLEVS